MKDKKFIVLKIVIIICCSVFFSLFMEKFIYNQEPFSLDRFIIYLSIGLFIGMHFIINIKKLWNQIFKKRYLIGFLLFAFLVVNGYHGSSIGLYNNAIQHSTQIYNGNPIIGENRVIRGDDWAVTNLLILSQSAEQNNYNTVNNTLMAESKPVNFYLKMPTKDISVLGNPSMIFFLVLPIEQAFSAYWNLSPFILFFATFELLRIITKNNKLFSLAGAIIVTFAPATQWWEGYTIIGYGEIAVIAFYKFLKASKFRFKLLFSVIIGWAGSVYIMTMYPAWIVPYAYFFLAVVIWMLYSQYGSYRWTDFLILIPIVIGTMCCIIIPAYLDSQEIVALTSNTVYPGSRFFTGGYGWTDMLKFFSSIFTSFSEASNPSEMSQFICFYPIPMILGMLQIIKNKINKRFDLLLILLFAVSLFLGIWNFIEIPAIISKITMLSMTTVERCNITLGFVNTILMIYCVSEYALEKKPTKKRYFIIGLISCLYVLVLLKVNINLYPEYLTTKKIIVGLIIFLLLCILYLINTEKTNKLFIILLSILSLGTGICVHPLNKGLGVVFDKPVSNKIQEIVSDDGDGVWITVNTPYYLQNYVAANGASIINSTNYYPNFNLWDKLDPNEEYIDIYNRYAHMTIKLTNDKTNVELVSGDHICLILNINELKLLNIDYILTTEDLTIYDNDDIDFNELYSEEGIIIYQISYK